MYEKDIIQKRAEVVDLTRTLEEKKDELNKVELADHVAKTWGLKVRIALSKSQSATDVQLGYLARHLSLKHFFEIFADVNGFDRALSEKLIGNMNASNPNFLNKSFAELLCWWFDTLPDAKPEDKGPSGD